jgi:uncharacterized membrane protein YbhN (UPF0104 family)
VITITFASFTPGRVGEFAKIYFLNRYKVKKPIATVFFERIFDLFTVITFSMLFFLFVMKASRMLWTAIGAFIALFCGFIFLFNLHRFKFIPEKYKKYTKELEIRINAQFFISIFITVLAWLFDALSFYFISKSLGMGIHYFTGVGLYCSIILFSLLSFLPSGLGTMELSVFIIFEYFSIIPEVALGFLLIMRVITFIVPPLMTLSITPILDFDVFKIRKEILKKE